MQLCTINLRHNKTKQVSPSPTGSVQMPQAIAEEMANYLDTCTASNMEIEVRTVSEVWSEAWKLTYAIRDRGNNNE